MAERTGISWARSTRNLWVGCTKVGPGCDGCYAEAFQRWTQGKDPETGEAKNWGPGRPRIPYLEGAARDLRKWNRKAKEEATHATVNAWRADCAPGFWPVFLNTQSDWFDNEVPQAWRAFGYDLIEECAALTFFIVTKRIGNVEKMVPARWMCDGFPDHVRLLITVVNQAEADRDIPKLLALPCKNGISYEPALGPVDWRRFLMVETWDCAADYGRRVEWLIPGGESDQAGHKARPCNVDGCIRASVRQCDDAGVPVFVKQLGSFPYDDRRAGRTMPGLYEEDARITLLDSAGADPAEWPEDIRVQEFPA